MWGFSEINNSATILSFKKVQTNGDHRTLNGAANTAIVHMDFKSTHQMTVS